MWPKKKLFWLDFGVLCFYATAVLVAVAYHEPWADEAQAWMIARDLPFGKMLFSEMHYEVSPGLWDSILWFAQHVFHAPYAAMNYIGAAFAIAGAAVLIFLAPFPRIVRYLMATSYYISYQYAVVARPYVLLLLCGGLAAVFYRRRQIVPLAIALAVMSLISIHGAILAGALAVGAAFRARANWGSFSSGQRKLYLVALAIVLISFAMVLVIAYPARDIIAVNDLEEGSLGKVIRTLPDVIIGPWPLAAILLFALVGFVVWRKQVFPCVLSLGGLLVFQTFFYGAPHHEGTIVIAMIVLLWISWPEADEATPRLFVPISVIALCFIFAIQTGWAVIAWRHEIANPYSGAQETARFLRAVGADQGLIEGFRYPSVAIQPYFNHNIFENWSTSYVHHSRNVEPLLGKLERGFAPPEYIIVPSENGDVDQNQKRLATKGYLPVHVSPGRILFKDDVWITETFTIYRRVQK